MTPEFAAYLQARLTELTAGLKFSRRRDGALVPPRVVRTQLPGKAVDYAEGDDFPLVRWAIWQGAVEGRVVTFSVIVNLGIWTAGTIDDGTDDIESLLFAVLGIASDRGVAGFRLSPNLEFHFGEQGEEHAEGIQPHPYHQAQIKLHFSALMGRNICTR